MGRGQTGPASGSGDVIERRRLMMAAAVLVAGLAGTRLLTACGDTDGGQASAVDAEPGVTATYVGFDGSTGSLDGYVGSPVVVNFFASWCVACLAELPGFERVHGDLAGRVQFIGLNVADDPAAGQAVIEQAGITYDVARDPEGEVFAALGAIAMPTTVLIDASGRVVKVHGGELSADALAELIEKLLL